VKRAVAASVHQAVSTANRSLQTSQNE